MLGGPRSLCAPSALATLCEVHDDGLQAARREAPSVPCLKFRRNIEELHRRGKRKAARGEAGAALSHLISYQPQAGPTPIPTGPIPMPRLMPGA